jgi:S1-C subfamily serine protease
MHVTITALNGQEAEREFDLQQRLQQFRAQRAHRVRALRQQLSQLVGMLELTDISAHIRQFYSR